MNLKQLINIAILFSFTPYSSFAVCPYDLNCLDNPYGAGNPYKSDGLMSIFPIKYRFESVKNKLM